VPPPTVPVVPAGPSSGPGVPARDPPGDAADRAKEDDFVIGGANSDPAGALEGCGSVIEGAAGVA
jgi:hypothetical protein